VLSPRLPRRFRGCACPPVPLYLAYDRGAAAPELRVARTCTICSHHRRNTIDKALLRGERLKTVACRYSVSDDALSRHRKHLQLVIAKAAALVEQNNLAYGSALLAEIGRIRVDAERLQIESERRRDLRAALRAIHERLAVVELEAKLSGQIDTGAKHVTVNVQAITQEEALEYAQDVMALFGPKVAPERELSTAVIEGDSNLPAVNPADGN
jgi:hypothetical protein